MKYLSGFHGILEMIRTKPHGVRLLVARESSGMRRGPRVREILEAAAKTGIPIEVTEASKLDSIDPEHRGIILAITDAPAASSLSLDECLGKLPERALVLVLDHIEDPQNFGAILRSADAFGIGFVIAPFRRASLPGDAVARASAGAIAWVPIVLVPNVAAAIERLKKEGFWIYAADMGGTTLEGFEFPDRSCIVLGNEGSGVSRLLKDISDGLLSVPMRGHVDSLNVSVAGALFMYEWARGS
ncbi:MAG TPA: 23S rRNA (guanosine(2251)-2'-O)-methyltransferase RlmB [Rectinemataceae bacterium]